MAHFGPQTKERPAGLVNFGLALYKRAISHADLALGGPKAPLSAPVDDLYKSKDG